MYTEVRKFWEYRCRYETKGLELIHYPIVKKYNPNPVTQNEYDTRNKKLKELYPIFNFCIIGMRESYEINFFTNRFTYFLELCLRKKQEIFKQHPQSRFQLNGV